MKIIKKSVLALLMLLVMVPTLIVPALAVSSDTGDSEPAAEITETAQTQQDSNGAVSSKALAAGIAIALVATGGALAMGHSVGKATEGIARQPEAESKIRTALMLGLVFIETAIIYALLVVILIIFVL